jgi:hypothetical protein
MDHFLIASIVGAVAVGGVALFAWYRARQLERSTEHLLRRISADIDELVLRTQRERSRQPGPHAPQQESPAGSTMSRAA